VRLRRAVTAPKIGIRWMLATRTFVWWFASTSKTFVPKANTEVFNVFPTFLGIVTAVRLRQYWST
jgi:hypothetical protein